MRVKFLNDNIRKSFFKDIKCKHNKNWREIREIYNISKATFERYIAGKTSIPEELFIKFLGILDNKNRKNILNNIKKLHNNHGQVKGGKIAYRLNYKQFEEGRKKGAEILKTRKKKSFTFDHILLSKEISEFVGAFIGDGFFNCYNNKLYHIEFAGDSRLDIDYYKERIIPIIKKVFPSLNPRIYKVKGKNSIRVVFYSKELFCYLKDVLKFTPGRKAHTVEIPNIIIENKSLIYPTIRGLFDTDGGIYFDKRKRYKEGYPRIHFTTVSKKLFNQVLEILSKEFKLYSKYNKKRNIYSLETYGHNNLKKWMNLIGFSNKRHLDKIASMA